MDWVLTIGLGLGAYFLGSIPSAYLLVRLAKGGDIRRLGTRNVGALNTYYQTGLAGALVVLLADTGKGAAAVLAPGWLDGPAWAVFVTTPMVVAGHNWPVFLAFRGGKGAAAMLGISLALVPAPTLIALGPALVLMLVSRNVVIGAALGFVLVNSLLVATQQGAELVALYLFLTLVVTATYVLSIRARIASSVKSRRWKELFYGPAQP